MTRICLLVGTVSGNAEFVAEEICDALGDAAEFDTKLMEETSLDDLGEADLLLVVCSTYGTGELPDNAKPLYAEIEQAKPDLAALRYGVICLGDSSYVNTFANGGKLWDGLLQACGAQRSLDPLVLDANASEPMEEAAIEWSRDWLSTCQSALANA